MGHVVLLGDSIFDNAAYVGGGPDVIRQVRDCLPAGWSSTLLARDGAVAGHVLEQALRLPADALHLFVSAGGNDALSHMGFLEESARSTADTLNRLAAIAEGFERDYGAMLKALAGRQLPTTVCTIYYPRFPDPRLQRLAATALSTFNDIILRLAFQAGLPVLDLRFICNEAADYANAIEPSSRGGLKIAGWIAGLVAEHDFSRRRTAVIL